MELHLLQGQDDGGWTAYHAIRRHVLYELRGRTDYDEAHPDEQRLGHFPMLFSVDGRPVGTARLDVGDDDGFVGTVRLVAIVTDAQRQGFGRAMMTELERFAAARGLTRLDVFSAHDAVGFYRKLGWHLADASRRNPLLTKIL